MQDMDKERKIVNTEISIHPEIEDRMSKFQKECLIEEIQSLPPIKEGDVNISTDFMFDIGDKYEVSIFIRNGLQKKINFENVPFLIIDKDNEVLGNKTFNLKEVGDIPPCSVRPWKIYFSKEEINLDGKDLKELKVVFDNNIKAEKTVKVEFQDFPEEMAKPFRDKYEKFLEELPLLRVGQVTITTYNVILNENGELSVVIIIRNGSDKQIKLERLPITVKDSRDIEVAKGVFELKDQEITVNPSKAGLYNFIVPKENIIQEELYLDKWSVIFQ